MTKPFAMPELLARVRAVLSRSSLGHSPALSVGDLVVDEAGHRVARGGAGIDLRPLEFRLLCALAAEPGRVLSKAQLLAAVRGPEVEVHVSVLRGKAHGPPTDPHRSRHGLRPASVARRARGLAIPDGVGEDGA